MFLSQINGENRAKIMLFGAYNNNKVANAYLFSGNNLEEMDVAAREFFGLLNSKKSDVNISHDLVEVRPEGALIRSKLQEQTVF